MKHVFKLQRRFSRGIISVCIFSFFHRPTNFEGIERHNSKNTHKFIEQSSVQLWWYYKDCHLIYSSYGFWLRTNFSHHYLRTDLIYLWNVTPLFATLVPSVSLVCQVCVWVISNYYLIEELRKGRQHIFLNLAST